jgi:hypothetical protein
MQEEEEGKASAWREAVVQVPWPVQGYLTHKKLVPLQGYLAYKKQPPLTNQ